MKKQLILVVSDSMDNNDKRNEETLIRMGGKARENLGLADQKDVELWPTNTTSDRINRSKLLKIHQAYAEDMKKLISDGMSRDKRFRVGFVTAEVFEYICGNGADGKSDVWISDSIDDTVIGSDPEFILLDNNNSVKYAQRVRGLSNDKLSKFSADGPLAELRPDPMIDVEGFVNSIQDLLREHPSAETIKAYKWKAGCCHLGKGDFDNRNEWPIGGHIHVGTPKQMSGKLKNDSYRNIYYITMQRVLDELLSIPMMRIDKKGESIPRRKKYGAYGDYRTEHGRLEHRTLSGMWMAHPRLALITLGTAKAIIDSFYKMLESKNYDKKYLLGDLSTGSNLFSNCQDWTKSPILKDMGIAIKSSGEMCDILNKYNIQFNKTYINKIRKILRKLPTYRKYSEYIDGLMELISLPQQEINRIDCDIKKSWVRNKGFII